MSSNLQSVIELVCPLENSIAIAPPYSIAETLFKKSQLVIVNYVIKNKFKGPDEYTYPMFYSNIELDISSKGVF